MARKTKKKTTTKNQTPQRGQIGPATVAAVDALVKEGLKKGDAIKKVAADTGRSVGTVTVTYYRLTRKKKAKKPTQGRAASRKAGRATVSGSVAQFLAELAAVLTVQEDEIERLRKENARYEEIRRLLR